MEEEGSYCKSHEDQRIIYLSVSGIVCSVHTTTPQQLAYPGPGASAEATPGLAKPKSLDHPMESPGLEAAHGISLLALSNQDYHRMTILNLFAPQLPFLALHYSPCHMNLYNGYPCHSRYSQLSCTEDETRC